MEEIDATTAWELVRIARRRCPGIYRAEVLEHAGARLTVRPDAAWAVASPCTQGATETLDLYLPLCATPGTSLVVGQMAQSLDGYVATASGHSCYVSGPEDRAHLHCLRALVDAVVVGAGTVAADDPRLTVRAVEGDQPVRVVLARDGAVDPAAHVAADGAGPTLVVHAPGARPRCGEGVAVPVDEAGYFEPAALVAALAERGLYRLLIEGGGQTVSRFLRAGALDRLHVTVAPLVIGAGRRGIDLPGVERIDEALRPPARRFLLGEDVLFDLDLAGEKRARV
jgi:riboflavin-specific deaminase-like protein